MHYWWLDSVYLFNLQCSEAQWVFLKWWDWRWTGAQSNVNLWLQQSQPKQVPGCGKYIYKYKLLNTNIFLCWLDLVFPATPLLVHPGCLTLLCFFPSTLSSSCVHHYLFVLCTECYTTLLQSSSKPFPLSSSSSLSRRFQPLKVVNRKRPPRDDWNNYSSQGDHEGDGPSQDVDQDICIKVRQIQGEKCTCQKYKSKRQQWICLQVIQI